MRLQNKGCCVYWCLGWKSQCFLLKACLCHRFKWRSKKKTIWCKGNSANFHCEWMCDVLPGSQSAAAGGGEPRGSSSSGRGGLPRRCAAGEDPERPGRHRPIAAPHPQRSTQPTITNHWILTQNTHGTHLDNFCHFHSDINCKPQNHNEICWMCVWRKCEMSYSQRNIFFFFCLVTIEDVGKDH